MVNESVNVNEQEYIYVPNFGNIDPIAANRLLVEYDKYIQRANEENRYRDGWFPVCMAEFYLNEMQE